MLAEFTILLESAANFTTCTCISNTDISSAIWPWKGDSKVLKLKSENLKVRVLRVIDLVCSYQGTGLALPLLQRSCNGNRIEIARFFPCTRKNPNLAKLLLLKQRRQISATALHNMSSAMQVGVLDIINIEFSVQVRRGVKNSCVHQTSLGFRACKRTTRWLVNKCQPWISFTHFSSASEFNQSHAISLYAMMRLVR